MKLQDLNKDTVFSKDERTRFGLHRLLPRQVETLEQQVVRAYGTCQRNADDLERHLYLRALQDTDEVQFYWLPPAH